MSNIDWTFLAVSITRRNSRFLAERLHNIASRSRNTKKIYFSARSQMSGNGATFPSMEKTPSVAIRVVRAPAPALSISFDSKSETSRKAVF